MDTIVLKFGGSSVSDNIKLNIVADKIKEFYKENNVVVVVSAQGKTTDNLLREAHELSNVPNERELDTLLSAGGQISMSKLSILLNRLAYTASNFTYRMASWNIYKRNKSISSCRKYRYNKDRKRISRKKDCYYSGLPRYKRKGRYNNFWKRRF